MSRLTVQQLKEMSPEEFKLLDSLEVKLELLKRQKPYSRDEMEEQTKRNSKTVLLRKMTQKDLKLILKRGQN